MKTDKENSLFQTLPPKIRQDRIIKTEEPNQSRVKFYSPSISFTGKKRKPRIRCQSIILPLTAVLFAYLMLSSYVESRLKGEIRELAEAQAQKHLAQTVNQAVAAMAKNGELDYQDMVNTVRGASGEVIYLEIKTGMLAGAKAKLVEKISESLEKHKKITVTVPFGSLTGWNLFSGFGLPIRVRVHPIGATEGEIYTVLEDCGINQTRHLIQVNITVKMLVVLTGENTTVETHVTLPLGERVLVGEVPEIYLDSIGAG